MIDEIPEVIYSEDNTWKYSYKCPHCNKDITDIFEWEPQDEYDENPAFIKADNFHIIKDPCFCEASGSIRQIYRCPHCEKLLAEYVSWDC